MADNQNKNIARRMWEVFGSGDLAQLDEFVAPDAAFHDAQDPFGDQRGAEHMKSLMQMYRGAFSNMQFKIKLQVAEDDCVCTLLEASGDNTGELMGNPATGRHTAILLTSTARIADDKIVESWSTWDTLGMLQQLGLIPAGAQRTPASPV